MSRAVVVEGRAVTPDPFAFVEGRMAGAGVAKRGAFLNHLAISCNVEAAAVAANVPLSTLLRWRRDDREFGAAWGDAIAQGYQMLELRLLAHALAGGDGGTLDGVAGTATLDGVPGTALAPINAAFAIKVMGLQRQGSGKTAKGPVRKPVSPEEIERRLVAKLDAMARRKRAQSEASSA